MVNGMNQGGGRMRSASLLVALSLLGVMGVGCSGESPVVGRSQGDSAELSPGEPETTVTQSVHVMTSGWGSTDPDDPSCMPFEPPLDSTGDASCVALRVSFPDGPCECEAPAFVPAKPGQVTVALEAVEGLDCGEGFGRDCASACVCEAVKATGDDLTECLSEEEPREDAYGWCYVSAERGNPELARGCTPYPARRLRALGPTRGDYRAVLACSGGNGSQAPRSRAIGEPCLPDDEALPLFQGFDLDEVSVYTESASCESAVCLVNHFQGRASCPYGQTEEEIGSGACLVPGSDVPVSVPVQPQFLERQAAESVTCSCRCDGPGDGPFCECPSGTECRNLIEELGIPGIDEWAGSYCIPSGSEYDAQNPPGPAACSAEAQSCGDAHPY
jgi:hypothetical protein